MHIERGELVSGSTTGPSSPDQITLYKSVGVAVQDAAAAAREQSAGEEITLR